MTPALTAYDMQLVRRYILCHLHIVCRYLSPQNAHSIAQECNASYQEYINTIQAHALLKYMTFIHQVAIALQYTALLILTSAFQGILSSVFYK